MCPCVCVCSCACVCVYVQLPIIPEPMRARASVRLCACFFYISWHFRPLILYHLPAPPPPFNPLIWLSHVRALCRYCVSWSVRGRRGPSPLSVALDSWNVRSEGSSTAAAAAAVGQNRKEYPCGVDDERWRILWQQFPRQQIQMKAPPKHTHIPPPPLSPSLSLSLLPPLACCFAHTLCWKTEAVL